MIFLLNFVFQSALDLNVESQWRSLRTGARVGKGKIQQSMLLINAQVSERKNALTKLPNIEILFDDQPVNTW